MQNTAAASTDHHKFDSHLPRNRKEGWLFFLIVSVISVNLIGPAVIFSEIGISFEHYLMLLPTLPLIWLGIAVVFHLVERPANRLTRKLTAPGDSFRATVTLNVLCNVLLMSVCMTIVGAWIGTRQVSLMPFTHFGQNWPRNFMIALIVEGFVAQPLARLAIAKLHQRQQGTSK